MLLPEYLNYFSSTAGNRHTDLAAKLIPFVRLALADALYMWLMNTVDSEDMQTPFFWKSDYDGNESLI
jgi:hypothetical protein